jgi:hypothetical protein
LLTLSFASCRTEPLLFQDIKSSHSGIDFANSIIENDSINQMDNGNVFNGGGVGIGDFNNDGLSDIFFTGNLVSCKLYINEGDFSFNDVTEIAGVTGEGRWCRGVAVVDINNDGFSDIYISNTIWNDPEKRKNILYVNQGTDSRNVPHFKDLASEYGLDDDSHTTQAAFFDYDNDGDLDVYLTVNEINDRNSPFVFRPVIRDGSNSSTGRLYRNDYDAGLKHPVFTDVSRQAGIQTEGYGNQASITDINQDGWKDIYVSNDYLMNDLLWINNRNGTFSERITSAFKHTSNSAMGNDAGDINNDGLMDFITLDMNPEDNYRKKMMLPPASYQFFQNSDRYGYGYQYTRNTLQLNQGTPGQADTAGIPLFSEIAYFAGVEATDWSWTPLLFDSDNDGYNDLFIANGFPRDITDRDFGMFRSKAWLTTPKADILKQVPEVKIHNYIFRNNSDLTFADMSESWGLSAPTFSNGAAYADFDNDGDLDLVINNINDEASLYRNNSVQMDPLKSNYLEVKLTGDPLNRNGLGAFIYMYYGNGKMQVRENNPYRGYISTSTDIPHFGFGDITSVDSMIINWQNGKIQKLTNITTNQIIEVNIENAHLYDFAPATAKSEKNIFRDVTGSVKVSYTDKEEDFVDFNIQKLLPHKLSEYGPSLASGDIDGNGLDDIITGGSAQNSTILFLQNNDGTFTQRSLLKEQSLSSKKADDMGILLFDADGDGDKDLYVSSGGYENESGSKAYQDHFFINDGKGNFKDKSDAFPVNFTSKACVRAADFDKDDDLDLFISGRVDPWNYPKSVSSFIYRNDSDKGEIRFTDITKEVAPALLNTGMVCDALFTDFNNDGWSDLVLAGEWMPVTFLKNENGLFNDVTKESGTGNLTGWWNSLAAGDFDNDGDIDYAAGNLGLNSYYRASPEYPVSIISGDFDNNGNYDAFPALFITTSQTDTSKKEYPAFGRDDAVKQMIKMRAGFQNYKSYAVATIDKLFSEAQFKEALKMKATEFRSSYFRNDGNNKFTMIPLPAMAQLSALNGMIADDFDEDGNIDILINTNDYSTDVLTGRYDALNGLLLKGNGNGEFTSVSIAESGIYIPGNGKALTKLGGAKGNYLIAASQNRGPLKIFELNAEIDILPLRDDDIMAEIIYENGKVQLQEFYYGNSFLSQSARFLKVGRNVKEVTVRNVKGESRKTEDRRPETEDRRPNKNKEGKSAK